MCSTENTHRLPEHKNTGDKVEEIPEEVLGTERDIAQDGDCNETRGRANQQRETQLQPNKAHSSLTPVRAAEGVVDLSPHLFRHGLLASVPLLEANQL